MKTLGLDCLAAARYQESVKKYLPAGFALGAFHDLFGNAVPLFEWALDTNHSVRSHLGWKDNHVFSEKDFPALVKKAKVLNALALKYPGLPVYLSPACEFYGNENPRKGLTRKAQEVLFDQMRDSAPDCVLVNAGINRKYGSFDLAEYHGDAEAHVNDHIVSIDGDDPFDVDYAAWKARHLNAEILFTWFWSYNCRKSMTDPTKRPDRKRMPTPTEFSQTIQWANTKPSQPDTDKIKQVKKPLLWKPEAQGMTDSRKGKPSLVSAGVSLGQDPLKITDTKGNRIGSLGYYGTFNNIDDSSRHYSGYRGGSSATAGQLAAKAIKGTGSPAIYIEVGKIKLAVGDPRNRQGGV